MEGGVSGAPSVRIAAPVAGVAIAYFGKDEGDAVTCPAEEELR